MTFCSESGAGARFYTAVELGELELWRTQGELRLLRDRIIVAPRAGSPEAEDFGLPHDLAMLLLLRAPQVGIQDEHRLVVVDLGPDPQRADVPGSLSGELVCVSFEEVRSLHPVSDRAREMIASRIGGAGPAVGAPRLERAWRELEVREAVRDSRRGAAALLSALGETQQRAWHAVDGTRAVEALDLQIDAWIEHWLRREEYDKSLGSMAGIDSNPFTFHPRRVTREGKRITVQPGDLRAVQLLAGVIVSFLELDGKDDRLGTVAAYLKTSPEAKSANLFDHLGAPAFAKAIDSLAGLVESSPLAPMTPWALLLFMRWREACRDRVPDDLGLARMHGAFSEMGRTGDFEAALYLLGRYLRWSQLGHLPASFQTRVVTDEPLTPKNAISDDAWPQSEAHESTAVPATNADQMQSTCDGRPHEKAADGTDAIVSNADETRAESHHDACEARADGPPQEMGHRAMNEVPAGTEGAQPDRALADLSADCDVTGPASAETGELPGLMLHDTQDSVADSEQPAGHEAELAAGKAAKNSELKRKRKRSSPLSRRTRE